jgi:hypothetical protein
MPESVWWLLGMLSLGALGFGLGRRSAARSAPLIPVGETAPTAKPPPKETPTPTAPEPSAEKYPLLTPDEPELLGESETNTKHNLFDKMPVVWDGNPQTSPRLPIPQLPESLLNLKSDPVPTQQKTWALVFAAGEFACKDIELDRSRLRVGRREGSDIYIPDTGVSKAHADVLLYPDGLAVIDLGSSNGTWLNGLKLPSSEPIPLKENDRLAFSSFVFRVVKRQGPGNG